MNIQYDIYIYKHFIKLTDKSIDDIDETDACTDVEYFGEEIHVEQETPKSLTDP